MKRFQFLVIIPAFLLANACGNNSNDSSRNTNDTTQTSADTLSKSQPAKKNVQSWKVDEPSSKVEFTIKNFGQDVHGTLAPPQGVVAFDENELNRSAFDVVVKVNTINTGNDKRDKDLMHEKYFNEAQFHDIIFKSDTIRKSETGYVAIGNLMLKGKSLKRELPFTFEQQGDKGIFKSQFTLQRLDYGIGGDGPIMGKDVNVSLEIVMEKK